MTDLILVGTWNIGNQMYASIRDNEGYLYTVLKGEYIEKTMEMSEQLRKEK